MSVERYQYEPKKKAKWVQALQQEIKLIYLITLQRDVSSSLRRHLKWRNDSC